MGSSQKVTSYKIEFTFRKLIFQMRWSLQYHQDLPVTRLFVFYLIKISCLLLQLEEAKKALDQMDVDKDGKVSYPEFLLVMKYKK